MTDYNFPVQDPQVQRRQRRRRNRKPKQVFANTAMIKLGILLGEYAAFTRSSLKNIKRGNSSQLFIFQAENDTNAYGLDGFKTVLQLDGYIVESIARNGDMRPYIIVSYS
jgi:hypothetical protein